MPASPWTVRAFRTTAIPGRGSIERRPDPYGANLRRARRARRRARADHASLATGHPQDAGGPVAQRSRPVPPAAAGLSWRPAHVGPVPPPLLGRDDGPGKASRAEGSPGAGPPWRADPALRLPRRGALSPLAAAGLPDPACGVDLRGSRPGRGLRHRSSTGEVMKTTAKRVKAYVLIETAAGKAKAVKKSLTRVKG